MVNLLLVFDIIVEGDFNAQGLGIHLLFPFIILFLFSVIINGLLHVEKVVQHVLQHIFLIFKVVYIILWNILPDCITIVVFHILKNPKKNKFGR